MEAKTAGDDDKNGPRANADENVGGHQQHAYQAQDHSHSAEQDRPGGRRAGPPDGIMLLQAVGPLLTVPRNDKE